MVEAGVFAGPAIRRLRRRAELTQAAMAQQLGISPSYLNLIERNQRPLSARLVLGLAERFDIDPRTLANDGEYGGIEGLRRRLADERFADLAMDRAEVVEWITAAPQAATAFARVYDSAQGQSAGEASATDPSALVRREIERWRNHFPELDAAAEAMADEVRLSALDFGGALAERLRQKHQLSLRILPQEVVPDDLRRLDLHARQLQLSEMLSPASRNFEVAVQLGLLEQRAAIQAVADGAQFADRTALRLFRRYLAGYFAAALIMPYSRLIRACEATGYDLAILQHRFGVGFEQLAHRLTTLQRVGQRGLPFFMARVDRAGQFSKRFAGASAAPLLDGEGSCPLWTLHAAFEAPHRLFRQTVELEDGSRWFTIAKRVAGAPAGLDSPAAEFAVVLGIDAALAPQLADAREVGQSPTPIGLGCRRCRRTACRQRSLPPLGVALHTDERGRKATPYGFDRD